MLRRAHAVNQKQLCFQWLTRRNVHPAPEHRLLEDHPSFQSCACKWQCCGEKYSVSRKATSQFRVHSVPAGKVAENFNDILAGCLGCLRAMSHRCAAFNTGIIKSGWALLSCSMYSVMHLNRIREVLPNMENLNASPQVALVHRPPQVYK
jgi:hypothetical protein